MKKSVILKGQKFVVLEKTLAHMNNGESMESLIIQKDANKPMHVCLINIKIQARFLFGSSAFVRPF